MRLWGPVALTLCAFVAWGLLSGACEYEPPSGMEDAAAANAYDQAEENALSAVESARVQLDEQPDPALYDGVGTDSPWSYANGGRTLGPAGGDYRAEVEISYAHTSASAFEVTAVGQSGAARRGQARADGDPGAPRRGGRGGALMREKGKGARDDRS